MPAAQAQGTKVKCYVHMVALSASFDPDLYPYPTSYPGSHYTPAAIHLLVSPSSMSPLSSSSLVMAHYGYLNYFLGFMPRRNIFLPTLCIVLLVAVWTFRLPNAALLPLPLPLRRLVRVEVVVIIFVFVRPSTSTSVAATSRTIVVIIFLFLLHHHHHLLLLFVGATSTIAAKPAIFTCIRYALEAGATGLTIPKIRKRSEKDLANLFTEFLPFSYMFDEQHFRDAFAENCPQITLYDKVADIPGAGESPKISNITPKDFGNRESCDPWDQNRHTDRFGQTFRRWLKNEKHGHPPTKEHPRLIRFNWGVLFDWQIYRDGPELATTFGGILKLNDKFLRLGKKTLEKMHAFARADGSKDGAFLGIHLRTESDALGFWPHYDTQLEAYMKQAKKRGYQTAYLATGNQTEAERFMDAAIEMAQMRVVTKIDLLPDEELDELDSFSWDQQGLIDYVVLLGSEFFVGVQPSSFSVHVAMKRHLKTGGLYTRPYKVGTEGDGLSYIVGKYDKYWASWLFLWDGMWP
ncbi:hypothetical protein CIB48_g11725 [Xylaria polymorpha]|nr:hypothetical protein CIB48_g11725 [Xylaria polymorpha]